MTGPSRDDLRGQAVMAQGVRDCVSLALCHLAVHGSRAVTTFMLHAPDHAPLFGPPALSSASVKKPAWRSFGR